MHIHTTQATTAGSALAGAQAAETSIALRRARELREKADKIKALAGDSDFTTGLAPNFAVDPQTIAMIGGWTASLAGQTQIAFAQALKPIHQTSPDSHPDTTSDLESASAPALDISALEDSTTLVSRSPEAIAQSSDLPSAPQSSSVSLWA